MASIISHRGRVPFREVLLEEGFVRVPDILPASMREKLVRASNSLVERMSEGERVRLRYHGSDISVDRRGLDHPELTELIAHPPALRLLGELGYPEARYFTGYIVSKAPGAPALYWHQDWGFWDDPVSADPEPAMLFMMYYLVDTSPKNGCLRVIPGSHRARLALHDELPTAHTHRAYFAPQHSAAFADHPQARDVPVTAGDVVVGDARLLHAAHANESATRRTCITLWFLPRFHDMSPPMKAAFMQPTRTRTAWWQGDAAARVEPLLPRYDGDAEPALFTRTPRQWLK